MDDFEDKASSAQVFDLAALHSESLLHARGRTHGKNIRRYRQLLTTSLTELEREFIERRLLEEQSAFEDLIATVASPRT